VEVPSKRVIKNFKEVPQVSKTSFKCALKRGKKKVIKKRFKEVVQVCPQEKKGCQKKSQRSCSSVAKTKVETTHSGSFNNHQYDLQ
jgi:hypothetical protein